MFGFGARPLRLDYLVLLCALIPWWWRHPDPLWYLRPSRWEEIRLRFALAAASTRLQWRTSPHGAVVAVRRRLGVGIRSFLGIGASG